MSHRRSHPKGNIYGRGLRTLRLAAGLTQAALVLRLQLTEGWDVDVLVLSYIENGRRNLTDIELSKILAALDAD